MKGTPTALSHNRVVSVVKHEVDSELPVSMTLIDVLSDLDDVDPGDYRPLYQVLDTDCLDGIFRSTGDDTPRLAGQVSFPFAGYHVTVDADGTITIRSRR